jgi:transposase-like protein
MAKCSMEFKMQIVQEYLNGEGRMDFLAKNMDLMGELK